MAAGRPGVIEPRLRLLSLWVSQVARVLADWTLRTVALLEWAGRGEGQGTAWYVAVAVYIAPFLLLSPVNGYLCNSLPRRAVLVATSAFALAVAALFAGLHGSWMLCLGLTALASAVYVPARYAMLPAAAQDSRIPLPRVNGCIEMGSASAIVAGLALGWHLAGPGGAGEGVVLSGQVPAALLGLNLVALLGALPAAFASEVLRPESPAHAVAGFFADLGRIRRVRVACASLLGLAAFQALITAGAGAIVDQSLSGQQVSGEFLAALTWVGLGTALGCLAAGVPAHPRRNLGLVPLAGVGLLLCLGWGLAALRRGEPLPAFPCLLLGFMAGLVTVPLRAAYQAAVPADARGNAMAVMNAVIYLSITLLSLLMTALVGAKWLRTPAWELGLVMALAAVGTGLCWKWLLPHAVELLTEGVLWPVYRIRVFGPGLDVFPREGPLLVVANHAAYMDPLWLSKVVPRHMTPMMTSLFYDRRVLRWLMVHIVGAIRVPSSRFRREAPELDEAVAELRRGGCVLIFPEAMLRRREDQLLRMFGQGVWRILREVPQTPVVVCWIEGGWGSYLSYRNGPPTHNKRQDWWRPIHIALEKPQVLPAELLADQRATRLYLMRACLACRRYLGLAEEEGKHVDFNEDSVKEG
jgi:1-acyl-sn-glycerol-3-phosphate acyltransferase